MALSFYELLREIEHKPGFYIGRPSLLIRTSIAKAALSYLSLCYRHPERSALSLSRAQSRDLAKST